MGSENTKCLRYELTHRKLQKAIEEVVQNGTELSVKKVAEAAGVSIANAYQHRCKEMILEYLDEHENS